jgi:hypothetical protein
VLLEAAPADSDGGEGAGAGSERNGHRSRIRTITRNHFASPPHGQGTQGCRHVARGMGRIRQLQPAAAPLSSELWHCTAYPGLHIKCKAGSHLGSTLKPGGAVLTLGVFRRSRSVAYIRADASPSEVLAFVMVPPNSTRVNLARASAAENATGRRLLAPLRWNRILVRNLLWLLTNHKSATAIWIRR